MKYVVRVILSAFVGTLILIGCSSNAQKPTQQSIVEETTLLTPTKDIIMTEGDLTQSYKILGQVEYASSASAYEDNPAEAERQVKDKLKKVAFTRYGDKVDAIINTRYKTKYTGQSGAFARVPLFFGEKVFLRHAEGIAVSFQDTEPDANGPTSDRPATTMSKTKTKSRIGK